MGHFRERIGLVHKLGQLTGSKEFLDHRRDRLGVNQILRGQVFGFRHGKTLFHRPLHADQSDAELVFHQFTDRADPPVTQVIDIVGSTITVFQLHQGAHDVNDVLLAENARPLITGTTQAAVQFHTADRGKVIAVDGEKEVSKKLLCGILGGGLPGAHHAVNLHLGFQS